MALGQAIDARPERRVAPELRRRVGGRHGGEDLRRELTPTADHRQRESLELAQATHGIRQFAQPAGRGRRHPGQRRCSCRACGQTGNPLERPDILRRKGALDDGSEVELRRRYRLTTAGAAGQLLRRQLSEPMIRRDPRIGVDDDELDIARVPLGEAREQVRQHRLVKQAGIEPEQDRPASRDGPRELFVLCPQPGEDVRGR